MENVNANNSQQQLILLPIAEMPALEGVFSVKNRMDAKDAEKIIGQTFALASRKSIASHFSLSPKKDGAQIDAIMLKATDALKPQLAGLAGKIAADPNFTGGRVVIRDTKGGLKVGIEFRKVKRPQVTITQEQAIKAMLSAGMSETDILTAIKAAQAESLGIHDVAATTTAAPEAAPETAPEAVDAQ